MVGKNATVKVPGERREKFPAGCPFFRGGRRCPAPALAPLDTAALEGNPDIQRARRSFSSGFAFAGGTTAASYRPAR